jgi:hypothetical protein
LTGRNERQAGARVASASFRTILANDDRPRTLHAKQTHQTHLLPEVVADLLARHEQRRAARRAVWREHTGAQRDREAA